MDWVAFLGYAKDHLSWIIPSLTSLFFALVTTILIICQSRWQKLEKSRIEEFMDHQKKLQQTQICIDLAENRTKVYHAFEEAFKAIKDNSGSDVTILKSFRKDTAGVVFFFGDDIQKLHFRIDKMLSEYRLVSTKIDRVINESKTDEKHVENVDRKTKLEDEFSEIAEKLPLLFKAYLGFSEYQLL